MPLLSESLNEIGSTNAGSAVFSVAFDKDGGKIVSGLSSGTIKVWKSGVPNPQICLSAPKPDSPCLPWQTRWSS